VNFFRRDISAIEPAIGAEFQHNCSITNCAVNFPESQPFQLFTDGQAAINQTVKFTVAGNSSLARRGFPRLGLLAAGAQLQREGFRLLQPFELFAKGQTAVDQAVEFPTALGGVNASAL
jgi:hypothetical protein